MSLLKQLETAVKNNQIKSQFTTKDLKVWINSQGIKNSKTSAAYSETYIDGFLSSSVQGSSSTKNDKKLRVVSKNPETYEFV